MDDQPPLAKTPDGTAAVAAAVAAAPTHAELLWLRRGLAQPGGKLPLFDEDGQSVNAALVRACIERGWAEPWFSNPLKPDWLICKLTEAGRSVAEAAAAPEA